MYISRIAKDKREQSTVIHLQETAKLASTWAKSVGFSQTASVIALLHDMGKFSKEFVSYLRGEDKSKRGSIIHSTQGAKYIYETTAQSENEKSFFVAEMIGLCIAGHHGRLMDGISPDGETPYLERILAQDTGNLHFDEVKAEFVKNSCLPSDLKTLTEASNQELQQFIDVCHAHGFNTAFMIHMLTKFLFSCLVDADRYNAYCFETNTNAEHIMELPSWEVFSARLDAFLAAKNITIG